MNPTPQHTHRTPQTRHNTPTRNNPTAPHPHRALETLSDGELLEAVRDGQTEAYDTLFTRHTPKALRIAHRRITDHQLAQDAVHEVFTAILAAIKAGTGPVGTFAPYLHSSITRQVHRQTRYQNHETPTPEFTATAATQEDFTENLFPDPTLTKAFQTLPERWQQILWHMDINNLPAKDTAPLFNLTPNATVALHRRAKTGLRKAFQQQQQQAQKPAHQTPPITTHRSRPRSNT